MGISYKGSVLFKYRPEDFIVEEIGEKGISNVSDTILSLKRPAVIFTTFDPSDRRAFLTCDLEKFNIDHLNAISILCQDLGKLPHEIGYAGTKDKVAWTSQRISIFNPDMERLKNFSHEGIILKNFRWAKHKIKIGDLKGNKFNIILRDVDKDSCKMLNRLRNAEYLPNFFGSQRYGSLRKDNFKIGRLILKRKFKEAVFEFLTGFGEDESNEVKEAKKRLKIEKDLKSALKYFPRQLHIESRVLTHLSNDEEDYLGALCEIGEKVLLIICQSVQSRLFDEILERATASNLIRHSDPLDLLGYDSKKSQGALGRIEEEVLKDNGLEINDFKMQEIPQLSLRSSKRQAFFKVSEIDIRLEDDELFPPSKKIILSFILDKGSYATTFLENFFDLR